MKTVEQWQAEGCGWIDKSVIIAIQDDAAAGLTTLQTRCANLERDKNHIDGMHKLISEEYHKCVVARDQSRADLAAMTQQFSTLGASHEQTLAKLNALTALLRERATWADPTVEVKEWWSRVEKVMNDIKAKEGQ